MTEKRFTIIYGVDENPFEWDLMDNEKDALICQCNGKPICDLLNELHEGNEQLKVNYNSLSHNNGLLYDECNNKINALKKENEQLKAQLYCTFDSVCDICNYHYLLPREDYYISQCRKEHTECGKEDIKYCDDFELKR